MATLSEDLGAALDAAEAQPEDENGLAVAEDAGLESQPQDTALNKEAAEPTGEIQDPSQTQATQPEGQPSEQQAAQPGSAMTPPATWSASSKAAWGQLPEGIRKEVIKREQDFARGIQQHAEKARGFDTFMEISRPYEAMLRAEGSDAAGALKSFLQQAYILRTASPQQKGELIMQVAQQFGADLTQFTGQPTQQQGGQQDLSQVQQIVQQLVAPHLQKIQQWEESQATAQQREAMQIEQDVSNQIETFRNATNEDGTPSNLYFENVRGLMSAYYAAGKTFHEDGRPMSMQEVYEMACWAHPEVRAALQAEQQRTADAKRLEEAKRKAQDAGRAGFNVSGQGGVGIAGATSTSLRDELGAQLDAAMGSARL